MWQALSCSVPFHPMQKCCPSWTVWFLFSLCMYKRKNEGVVDSSYLILGNKWTSGFHGCFNQGGSQQSYWKKQLDPSPSFLPIQPLASRQCKCDERVCFNLVLRSGSPCAGTVSDVAEHKGRGSMRVRTGSWDKGSQNCKYCQLKAQRSLLSLHYSQQTISCLVSSTLFFD